MFMSLARAPDSSMGIVLDYILNLGSLEVGSDLIGPALSLRESAGLDPVLIEYFWVKISMSIFLTIRKEKHLRNSFLFVPSPENNSKISKIALEGEVVGWKLKIKVEKLQTLALDNHTFLLRTIVKFGIVGKVVLGTIRPC